MSSWLAVSAVAFLLLTKYWGLGLLASASTVLCVLCERQRLSLFRRRHDYRGIWMGAFYPDDRHHVDA